MAASGDVVGTSRPFRDTRQPADQVDDDSDGEVDPDDVASD